jgi:hypothetical protein
MTKSLSIIVAAIALASCDAGNGKNDIIRFMPSMMKADVYALADSHQWKCENGYPLKNFSKTEENYSAPNILARLSTPDRNSRPIAMR